MTHTRSIFVTNNGLSDHIGVAQVLPYLEGLSQHGHMLECVSVEKPENQDTYTQAVEPRLKAANIGNSFVGRTRNALRKIERLIAPFKLSQLLKKRVINFKPDVVHCRSYMPLSATLKVSKKYNIPFIFDMRGFWIDQRIEGGNWKPSNPFWALVIRHFRRLEAKAIKSAAHIVVLTHDAKDVILAHPSYAGAKISVIPCSVDQLSFTYAPDMGQKTRDTLGFKPDDTVLAYLGSAGPLYRTDAVYALYQHLKENGQNPKLLFLGTHDVAEHIHHAACENVTLEAADIVCKRVAHSDIPNYLNAADFGLAFIIQNFSSLGVSATKIGEYLSCGLPVISNAGIGDITKIIQQGQNGYVTPDFSSTALRETATQIQNSPFKSRAQIQQEASDRFNMKTAVQEYSDIYFRFSGGRS